MDVSLTNSVLQITLCKDEVLVGVVVSLSHHVFLNCYQLNQFRVVCVCVCVCVCEETPL